MLLNITTPGSLRLSFATEQTFAVGSYPISVTAADVNGDGKPYLIVANQNLGSGTVSVLRNTTAPVPPPQSSPPRRPSPWAANRSR